MTPASLRPWIIKQLRFMAEYHAIGNTAVVADILDSGENRDPSLVYAMLGGYADLVNLSVCENVLYANCDVTLQTFATPLVRLQSGILLIGTAVLSLNVEHLYRLQLITM